MDPVQLGPFERASLDHCVTKERIKLRCNSKEIFNLELCNSNRENSSAAEACE
jgi:hypothetical protein